MSYEIDETECANLIAKAKADALAGVYTAPFPVVNGSAVDKAKKTAFNDTYSAAHGSVAAAFIAAGEVLDSGNASLQEQYEAKFGKKPHWKMKPETILAAIEE